MLICLTSQKWVQWLQCLSYFVSSVLTHRIPIYPSNAGICLPSLPCPLVHGCPQRWAAQYNINKRTRQTSVIPSFPEPETRWHTCLCGDTCHGCDSCVCFLLSPNTNGLWCFFWKNSLLGSVAGPISVRVAPNHALLWERSSPWKSQPNDAVNSEKEGKTPVALSQPWLLTCFSSPPSKQ